MVLAGSLSFHYLLSPDKCSDVIVIFLRCQGMRAQSLEIVNYKRGLRAEIRIGVSDASPLRPENRQLATHLPDSNKSTPK